jgi:hypothetical protein
MMFWKYYQGIRKALVAMSRYKYTVSESMDVPFGHNHLNPLQS